MPLSQADWALIKSTPVKATTAPSGDDRSERQFQLDQINGVTPVKSEPVEPVVEEVIPKAERGNDWNFIRESMKRGVASVIGMPAGAANWVINRAASVPSFAAALASKAVNGGKLPDNYDEVLPGFVQSMKNVEDAFGVDAAAIQRGAATPAGHIVGKAAEFAAQTPLAYTRYAKPALEALKTAPSILETVQGAAGVTGRNIAKEARNIPKNVSVATAAGAGAELGGAIGGGATENIMRMITDDEDQVQRMAQSGRMAGTIMGGSVAAPGIGATRYNAMAEAAKKTGDLGLTRFGAATEAAKAAWKAKRDGDARSISDIMLENYGMLRNGQDIGSIQRTVNERLADIIRQNPDARVQMDDFDEAMKRIGNKKLENSFSLGARTADPTILRLETQRRIDLPEEQVRNVQDRTRREELVRLYKDNLDGTLPVGKKSLEWNLEFFRNKTMDQIATLEQQAGLEKKAVPNWGPQTSYERGGEFRSLLDNARNESKAINDKNYSTALGEIDQAGGVDLSSVAGVTTPILKELGSQVQPTQAVLLARRLDDLIKGNGTSGKIELPAGTPRPGAKAGEVHQLQSDIGDAAHDAYMNRDSGQFKHLDAMQKALKAQLEKNPSYKAAGERYSKEHAPAFNEGLNQQMNKEARGGARQGLEAIPDEQVIYTYLKPDKIAENMQLFEQAFGGKAGIAPQPRAYEILGEGLSSLFSREVLNGRVTDEAVNAFTKKYEPALKLMPKTQAALEMAALKTMGWQGAQDLAKQRYEYMVTKAPIASEIGEAQAQQFFTTLMADPAKLRKVIAPDQGGVKGGVFGTPKGAQDLLHEFLSHAAPVSDKTGGLNYANFDQMMTLGQRTPDSPGTLRILAEAAYGPEKGAKFIEDLQTVSAAFKRDMPDPRLRRLADPSPELIVAGQTPASHISQVNAWLQGRIGGVYYPVIAGSRFMNAQIQKHVREAESRALHDPEMMAAIAELARTPANRPVNAGAIDKIFGASAKFVKTRLLDQHLLAEHAAGGAAIGAAQGGTEMVDEERANKKVPKRKPLFGE